MSRLSIEKDSPVKELLKQHEEKMRPVDERLRDISFRDVDTNVGMFLNQPLLACDVKIEDKKDFENVLRTVEKISKDSNGYWKIFSNFYDDFFTKTVSPYFFKTATWENHETMESPLIRAGDVSEYHGKIFKNYFKDQDILDFTLASKAFCFAGKIKAPARPADSPRSRSGYPMPTNALNLIISADNCPDILKKLRPDLLSPQNLTLDYLNNWLDNLEKIRDDFRLSPLEFSSLTANSLFLTDFRKFSFKEAELVQQFFYNEDILDRVLCLKGIDKDVFDVCLSKNFAFNITQTSKQFGLKGTEIYGTEAVEKELWHTFDAALTHSSAYSGTSTEKRNFKNQFERLHRELEYMSPPQDSLVEYMTTEKINIYDKFSKNERTGKEEPRVIESRRAMLNFMPMLSLNKTADIPVILSSAGGNTFDSASYDEKNNEIFRIHSPAPLVYLNPDDVSLNDKNVRSRAILAATFPAIGQGIIDELKEKKNNLISLDQVKTFEEIYLNCGGSYVMLL